MLFSRAAQVIRVATAPKAASSEFGWDIVDMRTGKMLSAGHGSDTGEPVNAETAFGYHAWYRAIALIAQKSAAVPRLLFRTNKGKKGLEELSEGDAYTLIHQRANSEQTSFQFWLQMTGHVASRGNGYAAIYRTNGKPSELIPLDPDRTHPVRKDGAIWYVCFPFGYEGQGYKYRDTEVLHFRGFGFDGLCGYPVWQVAANEIALGKAERKLEGVRYKNSGRPSMILETDMKLDVKTAARVRNEWHDMQEGIDNAGKVAVLSGGLKAKPISINPKDMEQSAASQMSLAAISNFTGVPVSKLGGEKTYANQEQEDRAFINDGLDFYLNVTDDECSAKLLTEAERKGGQFVRSDREALLRPDSKTKAEFLRILTGGKPLLSQNEGREVLEYPPSKDDGADSLGMPLNIGKGGINNQPKDSAGDDPGRPENDPMDEEQAKAAREAARFALSHATARMVKRVAGAAKHAASRSAFAFTEFVVSLPADHSAVFASEFAAAERIASAVNDSRSPAAGSVAAFLVKTLQTEFDALGLGPKAAAVSRLCEEQLLRLPQKIVDTFLE